MLFYLFILGENMNEIKRVSYKIGDEELILETGLMAKQTNGTVYAQFGGSAIIATNYCITLMAL
jgi:polyribonucleotide nucleotidyltransferase